MAGTTADGFAREEARGWHRLIPQPEAPDESRARTLVRVGLVPGQPPIGLRARGFALNAGTLAVTLGTADTGVVRVYRFVRGYQRSHQHDFSVPLRAR